MDYKLAECVGLWLAEGDNKTKFEITFTNNCWKLIELFYKTVIASYAGKPRIYVYSVEGYFDISLENCKIKQYTDKRARRPYFILRLASAEALKDWKTKVAATLNNQELYSNILKGFFAGEGNIKTGTHANRTIRIAQKQPKEWINNILDTLGILYTFSEAERSYVITGTWNWKKFAELEITNLHPEKKEKFWKAFNSFKEEHYPDHHVKNFILNKLSEPHTKEQLAKELNRSKARIYDILNILKKQKIIINFRVGSRDYWVKKDSNKIVISRVKKRYMKVLNGKRTSEIAKIFKVTPESAYKRLNELVKLYLVKRDKQKLWWLKKTNKKIIVK